MKSILCWTSVCALYYVNCLEPLIGTDDEKCLECICFAATHCYDWRKCLNISVSRNYWERAGSPTVEDEPPSEESYEKCLRHKNCFLNTMKNYTSVRGSDRDANCDGKFDCKDRLAIHFNGYTDNYTLQKHWVTRFDICAGEYALVFEEDWTPCQVVELQ